MMKKYFTFLFVACSVFYAKGQVTLTNLEAFKIGDMGIYINSSPAFSKIGQAGPNRTWDYSFLDSNSLFTVRLVAPASTPYGSYFPNANMAEKNSDSSYNYLQVSKDTNLVEGIYNNSTGVFTSTPYLAGVRPVSYPDSFFSTATHQYTISGAALKGYANIKITTDGYGTLKLPNGTYSHVLRQRIDNISRDSDQSGSIVIVDVRTYIWFDAAHKFSLLKIDSVFIKEGLYNNTSIDVKYLADQKLGIQAIVTNSKDLHIVNRQNELLISAGPFVCDAVVEIVSTDGRIVLQQAVNGLGEAPQSISTGQLKPGIYVARVLSATQSGILKFYKE